MTNEEYLPFEVAFQATARPLLEALRQKLTEQGAGPFTEIDVVDKDVSRGLGFDPAGGGSPDEFTPFVELMLEDGGEHGYEGVGLVMNCSIYFSGQVWAPFNYTESVGMSTPEQVVERILQEFDPSEIAISCLKEWESNAFRRSMERPA